MLPPVTVSAAAPDKPADRPAIVGWVLFDWAAQPYFTLINTFVYAPFFASAVAANPVEGQAMWGFATSAAGIAIALLSPVLGAIADASGRRKPWIAAFGLLLVVGASLLWLGKPGAPETIAIVLVAFVLATIGAEFATVFNNSMMPTLVSPERIGRLSGLGWAVGYVGGMMSLIFMLGFLVASPETGRTLIGLEPLFGLDAAQREGDRAAGPLTALWFILFVIPLFLFTPDVPARMSMGEAVRSGFASLKATVKEVRRHRNVLVFLLANMIYMDGLVALFALGGIYAAGVFGWTTIEIGLFGILLTITGTAGALLGGRLDDTFFLTFAVVTILLIGPGHVFFIFQTTPPTPGDGLFATAPERVYLVLGGLIGAAAGPLQAASRSLLVRLAPREQIGQFFGLFALSGKVTAFIGPFLASVVTLALNDQRAGLGMLAIMFLIGASILAFVRVERASFA
ncbi:MAG: MFS transporter UMF1 family [Xanthobacteraceae bacterium]|nr:MAG: MFS transporter UMF1 family [Xanthobacteraceae bacterium]